MLTNKLKLNGDKTEFMVIASPYYQKRIRELCPQLVLQIVDVEIQPTSRLRNLDGIFDNEMNMTLQVTYMTKLMFMNIRLISRIRNHVDYDAYDKLIQSLVFSHLDRNNSLFADSPDRAIKSLQKAQNCAARLFTMLISENMSSRLSSTYNGFLFNNVPILKVVT